jgi:selenoprotein W-related protein
LAAELKRTLKADTELVAGHGGVFEITVDGNLLFSKKSQGRFPEEGEVLGLIRSR